MKRIILAIAALLVVTCAHAQTQTKSYLQSLTASLIPDNNTNAVSPGNVRSVIDAVIVSACTIGDATNCPFSALSGIINSPHTWTGVQTFSAQFISPSLPGLTTNVEGGGQPGLDMPGCTTAATCSWEIFSSPTAYPAASNTTLFVTKVAPASGGVFGNTYSVIEAQAATGLNDPGFQWAFQSVLHERSLVSTLSQNVGVAATIFKELNGQSAGTQIGHYDAALFGQCVDLTLVVNPTGSCEGAEIDVNILAGGGTDTNKQRLILALIGSVQNGTDAGVHIGTALAIGTNGGAVIDAAVKISDASAAQVFQVFGNGGTQINSNFGSWSNVNVGKQLIVMPETNSAVNPAIGISDSNSTNFLALENATGTLIIEGMPALANSSTAPVVLASFGPSASAIDSALTLSSTLLVTSTVTAPTFVGTLTGHASLDLPLTGGALTGNISIAGSVLSSSRSGGVGYATGAGGTVTQATSKSTGVTLNTLTGAITMNAAALAAATTVQFTLTDSSIGATDTLVINHISGGTLGAYGLTASARAGFAVITVGNPTGGTLSEAIVIEFSVIKGATS